MAMLNKGVLKEISIDALIPNEYNDTDDSDITELKKDILKNGGLVQPVSVIGPTEDNKYVLISGHRRIKCLCEIRRDGHPGKYDKRAYIMQARDFVKNNNSYFDRIPCYVIGAADMPIDDQKLLLKSGNVLGSGKTAEEKVQLFLDVIGMLDEKYKKGEIKKSEFVSTCVKYLDCSDSQARRYISLYRNGNGTLIEAVKKGVISIGNVETIVKYPDSVINDLVMVAKDMAKYKVVDLLNDLSVLSSKKEVWEKIKTGEVSFLNFLNLKPVKDVDAVDSHETKSVAISVPDKTESGNGVPSDQEINKIFDEYSANVQGGDDNPMHFDDLFVDDDMWGITDPYVHQTDETYGKTDKKTYESEISAEEDDIDVSKDVKVVKRFCESLREYGYVPDVLEEIVELMKDTLDDLGVLD
mgnify:CR=1 FL=1